jgi:FKBP-type peptidyl-prolyl cis-trans isomerase
MSISHIPFVAVAFVTLACSQADAPAQVTIETDDQKMMYAVGMGLGLQFELAGMFSEEELALVAEGLKDAVLRKPSVVEIDDDYMQSVNQVMMGRRGGANSKLGAEYVIDAAAEDGAVQTASGLVYVELVAGEGAAPAATDTVTVHYEGRFIDGRVFDSSIKRGEPATFTVSQVIPGWIEGLQMMKPGGKARLVVPGMLAYGPKGYGNIPPNATLIFEVELLKIQ